jgi:transcriptional regulator with XRE-family HTH domain
MTIGDLVRNKRLELNMTQEDLAKAVGTTKATVSRWESGDIHKMKRSMIEAVCVTLQLDPIIFFRREEVLLPDEYNVITAYRQADDGTKSAVRKLLDVPEAKKDTMSSVG